MSDTFRRLVALAGLLALGGCATMSAPGAEKEAAAPAAVPSAQAIANAQKLAGAPGSQPTVVSPPPLVNGLRPFADVVRDAKEQKGLFHLWQKDEKVWLEIAPEQFDHPYFFSTNLDQGLGENRFLAGSMSSSLARRFGR